MGLAERKAIAGAQANEFTPFAAKLKEICGYDVKLDFDWAKLEAHKDCVWIIENKKCTYFIFDRVLSCFKTVCKDDMGKSAVREGLKEIKIIPEIGSLEFTGGTLIIRNDVTGKGAHDDYNIQEILEKGL